MCFATIKKGFLAGCRTFFGIDGCFLKGPFGETIDGSGYTIMSDQQKGLLKAISIIWPKAETRCCARHVYCNLRQIFGGALLNRRRIWKVAKSITQIEFKANMELFSSISIEAEQDLMKRNYKKWVRAFLSRQSQCDSIDNNMNERDIREGLMERLHKKRDFIANKDIGICPRIQQKLEKAKVDARGWSAFWDCHFSYGVREGATQARFVVSLLKRTCSCNAWQLSDVPCHHVVAAIWKVIEHPEHYVAECFTKWPTSNYPPIEAYVVKKLQHRPTVERKSSIGEVDIMKASKKGLV
ncbi:uncharacterized protein LOC125495734 [Beta vulgaris subsp. vulgaris]|uniref:uncharacterized protein LOC125495734 n=1 Tax=Beta vulgaris subsp. vulgaris TaxID=3555 RepID=UPI0020372FC0|nr:uncharacterized protein LOC125495734 [Beta vulgaris subsp. vulgaris]